MPHAAEHPHDSPVRSQARGSPLNHARAHNGHDSRDQGLAEAGGSGAVAVAVTAGALGLAMSVALLVAGLKIGDAAGVGFAAAGALGIILVVTFGPLAVLMARRSADRRDEQGRIMLQLTRAVEQLQEQNALSEDARRVLHRRGERELLRRAIEEDIAAEDWDAAMVLVKELAERFGYRVDAEEFRQRIDHARFETVQRRVADAVARLDALIVQRRWDQAIIEAARVGRMYPDSPRVEGLRHRVEQARTMYKSELERRFLTCAQEERIDEAMHLLKELDQYLSEAEAEPFREVARGVIGKARDNLGASFKLAVKDGNWPRAGEIGERIIAEFPNSGMANEVRGMIDSIRAKSGTLPRFPREAAGVG